MPLNRPQKNALATIFAKELGQFFSAPIAWLFLAAFLLVTLFVFFWVESFFARNIADVRPLFSWMPLLLIFLSAALTMKMWSEERKTGTLEYLLTRPVPLWQFVVGKFLACWALLGIALVLTLPLAITVSRLGDLDWGPVWSGYVAAMLLGGAYLTMGLFVSARCDNQIVSLILTVALAGVFYLIGAGLLTNFVGNQAGDIMRSLGTGSRFESINRGVLDVRDLYYYLSLIIGFLALNVYSLERGRWARDGNKRTHNRWRAATFLLVVNALVVNLWLSQVQSLRIDTTRGNLYSISDATRGYLAQLQEPLLVRGYFSEKTHPLLAPLVPQMQDLLREYEVAGDGRVKVEIIDPTKSPELEDEANKVYGIRPTPFRVNDRHQAAVVNSYFNILIQYGSENEVLGFDDLIEVRGGSEGVQDVLLRNPEYDLTRALKKVLYAYQTDGNIFNVISEPVTLTGYLSDDQRLPKPLVDLKKALKNEISNLKSKAGEKLTVRFVEPEANDGAEAKRIEEQFGFAAMAASPFDPKPFYFYVTLSQGEKTFQVDLGDFSDGALPQSLQAGLKRFAEGFTRTVALVSPAPKVNPQIARQMGMPPESVPRFDTLRQFLSADMNVIDEDLSDGHVDSDADLLMLLAPELTDDVQRFAVDQFLMRGGTVLLAAAPFGAEFGAQSMDLVPRDNGLSQWLAHFGIRLTEEVVMDKQSAAFPVPTVREAGGMRFQEVKMLDYPYFVSVRGQGLNEDSAITQGLPEVTVPWAAAMRVESSADSELTATELLRSSSRSWLGQAQDVLPTQEQVTNGYRIGDNAGAQLLGAVFEGRFRSYFDGKTSPLLTEAEVGDDEGSPADESRPVAATVIGHSPTSARLIVFSSNDIFRDEIVGMLGSVQGGAYLNTLQLAMNSVEWALEDRGLLGIRSRGHFNRTLMPMATSQQKAWEYSNYAIALAGLFVLWLIYQYRVRTRRAYFRNMLAA